MVRIRAALASLLLPLPLPLLMLAAAAATGGGCGATFRRAYTREDLRAQLARRFPIEKRRSVFFVRMTNPDVTFPGGDRIGVEVDLEAGAVAPEWRGHAAVEGRVEYDAVDGAIYLREPVVRKLEVAGVGGSLARRPRELAEAALTAALTERPIYVLDPDKQRRARAHLRRMWVENDRLILELTL